jgi:hypothetical protein
VSSEAQEIPQDTASAPVKPQDELGTVIINKVRHALSFIRLEEWLLLALWTVAYLAMLYSQTYADSIVLRQYLSFFGPHTVYAVLGSRFLFLLGERWQPQHPTLRRLYCYIWGPTADYSPTRWDRWILKNPTALDSAKPVGTRSATSLLWLDVEFARGVALLFINLTLYTNLKVRIPFINSTVGDPSFIALDRAMFGNLPAVIERWFQHSPAVQAYFTKVYMHDYMWMVVLAFIFYVRRDRFSLRWLFASVTLVYILGVLITMLYPSYGPCFLEPGRFGTQANLAGFYDLSVKTVHAEGAFRAAAFMGIAAFPSLHVAHMVILVMIAWRTFPLYSLWMVWMTTATTIATIGFGWHYIADALGGLVLAVLVTELLYRYYRRAPKATAIAPPNET